VVIVEERIVGTVLSVKISEMTGFQFGTIVVETEDASRYDLKYGKKSEGIIPAVGEIVTVCYKGESMKNIIWLKKRTASTNLSEALDLVKKEQFEDALLVFEEAAHLDPNDPDVWYHKAKLHHQLDQIDRFKECYTKFSELSPDPETKFELDLLLQGDKSVEDVARIVKHDDIWSSRKGYEIVEIPDAEKELIQSYMEQVTRDVFGEISNIQSQIVHFKETSGDVYLSNKYVWHFSIPIRNLMTLHSVVSESLKKREYVGSIWIYQKFRRSDDQYQDITYSVLYQGVLSRANTLIFPNVTITAVLDYSVPHAAIFASTGSSKKKKVYYSVSSSKDGKSVVKRKPQLKELKTLKDAQLHTLYLDQTSDHDAGILAQEIASSPQTEIMDLLTDIPSFSRYKTRRKSVRYTFLGFPILSINPWQEKTMISLQMSPYMSKSKESQGIVQKLQRESRKYEFEIGQPNLKTMATALQCIEKFRTSVLFPRTEIPHIGESTLWSQALLGLEFACQDYFPDSQPLDLKEILTYSKRTTHIVNRLNRDYSSDFHVANFKPIRGLYQRI